MYSGREDTMTRRFRWVLVEVLEALWRLISRYRIVELEYCTFAVLAGKAGDRQASKPL